MQRYFVPATQMGQQSVALEGEDARHAAAVMRSKPGDCFIACDGQGRDVLAKIVTVDKDNVHADIMEELTSNAEMAWQVTVAQSLPKGDKLEIVIQKGTEAGAVAFQPFLSQRTVVQYDDRKEAKRIERWRKIAKEASEQSHRSLIPTINAVLTWKSLIKQFAEFDLVLLCYEEEGRAGNETGNGLRDVLREFKQSQSSTAPRVMVVIGPEGGLTAQEAETAAASGAKLIGLGKRILRTETAALFALACLAYESGELGGN
ncbi:16S rRNA (uracil(1498)-N(3))-methyltransferase [Cohnella lupini]|uniref:Ribosomal RNA small subunit methyltransferase E n=1 Tax=Cohnella lupini TaxID=1294267 RepID=A0A3D9IV67_9BACL|nr:16S rRNA (uracil(1498)-N(3))-methyltransferase [Cohnella lupini]RED65703.1 16S rRNA (uracil1498-N3)-methyltransferase [Cohnella lupini]